MKTGAPPKRQRCVIYTRKSSDEGLEQEFNSLDAQREACAAYIASQAGEGWRLLPSQFDDGGYSGGNMERPALRQLMEAIDGGMVDVVVVYKVDRLTRSLTDFVRIVERFDAQGVSFVSVTQSFNTTTSMGRLTLNVLLSFAQFEREVTGERIRDKIAASKAKGLWMGGRPPLGYNPVGRTLEINAAEAETVRHIFARYLELGSVHYLTEDLAARHIRSKSWTTRDGRRIESAPFARGALYYLLRNRLYLGEIVHKGVHHEGRHPAILDAGTFAAVQASLDAKVAIRTDQVVRPGRSPLTGILFDSAGNRMSPSSTRGRNGKPHRYYVSKPALTGRPGEAGSIARVPAETLEGIVRDRLGRVLPEAVSWEWEEVRRRLRRVVVADSWIEMTIVGIPINASEKLLSRRLPQEDRVVIDGERVRLILSARLKVGRGKTALINASGRVAIARRGADQTLAIAVARARAWREQLVTGAVANIAEIARQEGITDGPVFHLIRLAYLSPDVTRAILAGRQRADLHLEELIRSGIPTSWSAQRRLFGLSSLDLPTTPNAL